MGRFMRELKHAWLLMLEPPWHHTRLANRLAKDPMEHWVLWSIGWAWALAGTFLGALVAPSLIRLAGLSGASYQDEVLIGVAIAFGFLAQLVGWVMRFSWHPQQDRLYKTRRVVIERLINLQPGLHDGLMSYLLITIQVVVAIIWSIVYFIGMYMVIVVAQLLPFVGVGYGIYRYLTWVGAGQRTVTITFVFALLIKTFGIPFIKGIVTGALFQWLLRWLRGKDATKAA